MNLPYAAIMALSIISAILLSARGQKRLPLTTMQRWGMRYAAFVGSMIGAKLPFLLTQPSKLLTMSAWVENGKTIVFGLAFGYFAVELAKYLLEIKIKTGDTFAVPAAVGIAIGRWSCFVGGCCYGRPTTLPWGVNFGDGQPRHPTQIYEFAIHLTAAVILARLARKGLFQRQLLKLYFISYFTYRFFSEFLRPEPHMALGLTFYQWTSIVLIPIFALLWWHDANQAPMAEEPRGPARA